MLSCSFELFDLPGGEEAVLAWLKDDERGIRVGILPEKGGGLTSFQVRRNGRYRELLYRALDYRTDPPDGWEGRAPLLWPAVGRSYTEDQVARWRKTGRPPAKFQYLLDGKVRPMPMHGFARQVPWELRAFGYGADGVWAACELKDSRRTRRFYPYAFTFTLTYRLNRGELALTHEVVAGANKGPMPFGIGNHVSFNLPLTGRGRFEDCTVRTPGDTIVRMNPLAAPSGKRKRMDLSKPTRLDRPELLDNLLGGYRRGENWLEMTDPSGPRMHIHHEEKSPRRRYAAQKDFLFVFWGVPELGYYCPEPWVGLPDSLNTGRGLIRLPPGERFVWEVVFRPTLFQNVV